MHAHMEPVSSVIRVYEDGCSFEHGDKYVWAATVKWIDKHTVEILGVDKAPSLSVVRTIRKFFEDECTDIHEVWMRRHGRVKVLKHRDHK